MLLVIDVGNTHMVLGVYDGDSLIADWRLATIPGRTEDELGVLLRNLMSLAGIDHASIRALAVSCVVPPLTSVLGSMARQYFGIDDPVFVEPGVRTGMRILYDHPQEVGADRIVNAVAAFERYRGPVIIVDFGTATTFDAVSEQGDYLGGAIAPGVSISAQALFDHAARLPRVDIVPPPRSIGKNTVHSMQSGLFWGYVGLVDGLLDRMRSEMGDGVAAVATGGLAVALGQHLDKVDHIDPDLTLEGLHLIYKRNRT